MLAGFQPPAAGRPGDLVDVGGRVMMVRRIALIGARGYTGAAVLELIPAHPGLALAVASSSSRAGQAISEVAPAWAGRPETFDRLETADVPAVRADVWVLALPDGAGAGWVAAIEKAYPEAVIVDLSADHRFAGNWAYGLPELNRAAVAGARRIANPGCYATAAQLALAPLVELMAGPPVIFGVSGYSGAGRTPSPRNDRDRLADNLMPYALTGHVHEREIGHRLGCEVRFHPHVAAFFRGLSLTVSVILDAPLEMSALRRRFDRFYQGEARVHVCEAIPEIREVVGTPDVRIGGLAVDARDARRVTLVAVLDNLRKGAASQAMQNINLALAMDENAGIVAESVA